MIRRRSTLLSARRLIEHVLIPETDNFMRSLTHRIAPGGLLFLTTPFSENLVESDVYCPCCDHLFHRWQHQRSWNPSEIEGLMMQWDLKTEWIGLVGFDDASFVHKLYRWIRRGKQWLLGHIDRTIPVIGSGDHIVYIGRKPISP